MKKLRNRGCAVLISIVIVFAVLYVYGDSLSNNRSQECKDNPFFCDIYDKEEDVKESVTCKKYYVCIDDPYIACLSWDFRQDELVYHNPDTSKALVYNGQRISKAMGLEYFENPKWWPRENMHDICE